ncbi:AAA domain-containing protein [Spiroplasma endosymbiont of Amphibalanus improvisus]|uniref:AAA domain-containing protein n=1 Tax=Spiroplasma endosymbiont of Amphibalanus improvisus TaxID=3066327 RepID=UPI00313B37BB
MSKDNSKDNIIKDDAVYNPVDSDNSKDNDINLSNHEKWEKLIQFYKSQALNSKSSDATYFTRFKHKIGGSTINFKDLETNKLILDVKNDFPISIQDAFKKGEFKINVYPKEELLEELAKQELGSLDSELNQQLETTKYVLTVPKDEKEIEKLKKTKLNDINKVILKIKKIINKSKELLEERNVDTFYVGYPFVKAFIKNDRSGIARAPLFLWKLDVEQKGGYWILKIIKESPVLNNALLANFSASSKQNYTFQELNFELFNQEDFKIKKYIHDLFENIGYSISESQFINVFKALKHNFIVDTGIDTKPELLESYNNVGRTPSKQIFIENVCAIGIFDLSKSTVLGAYKELEKTNLQEFFGELFQFNDNLFNDDAEKELQIKKQKQDLTLITPLDESQKNAVTKSLTESSTIWGPPGTGKSQTLLNLTANIMHQNKNAIFVTQKRVASDVIFNKLGKLNKFIFRLYDKKLEAKDLNKSLSESIKMIVEKTRNYTGPKKEYDIFLQSYKKEKTRLNQLEIKHRTKYVDFIESARFQKYLKLTDAVEDLTNGELLKNFDCSKITSSFMKEIREFIFTGTEPINSEKINLFVTIFELKNQNFDNNHIWKIFKFPKNIYQDYSDFLNANIFDKTANNVDFKLNNLFLATKNNQWDSEAILNLQNFVNDFASKEFDLIQRINDQSDTEIADILFKLFRSVHDLVELGYTDDIIYKIFTSEETFHKFLFNNNKLNNKFMDLNFTKHQNRKFNRFIKKRLHEYNEWIEYYEKIINTLKPGEIKSWIKVCFKLKPFSIDNNYVLEDSSDLKTISSLLNDQNQFIAQFIDFNNAQKWIKFIEDFKEYLKVSGFKLEHVDQLNKTLYAIKNFIETDNKTNFSINDEIEFKQWFDFVNSFTDILVANNINNLNQTLINEIFLKIAKESYELQDEQYLEYVSFIKFKFNPFKKLKILEENFINKAADKLYNDVIDNIIAKIKIVKSIRQKFVALGKVYASGKTKHIRILFRDYYEIIKLLFPIIMSDPIHISNVNHFPMVRNEFEYAVFDEASQIYFYTTLPILYRAKKHIVSGDEQQMPPSNQFEKTNAFDEEDEEYNVTIANTTKLEGLGDYNFNNLLEFSQFYNDNKNMLQYHYRSQYEELIAFSNSKFYENKLHIINKKEIDNKLKPLNLIQLEEGHWDGKVNVLEANKIIDLIKELTVRFPDKTIGVITFNQSQQELIQIKLEQEAMNNTDIYKQLEREATEALFVKNIENVQGDERDIILFSIAYSRKADGTFSNQYGSLSKDQGEKRLNVAISRSKHCVYIVKSLDNSLIKSSKRGPRLLKEYLDYIELMQDYENNHESIKLLLNKETNDFSTSWKLASFDSDYEIEVFDHLRALFKDEERIEVRNQVSVLNYHVDLALFDKKYNQYIMGIECDGAQYHSSQDQLLNDHVRQAMIENKGWTIERILSTDWWNLKHKKSEFLNSVKLFVNDYVADYE